MENMKKLNLEELEKISGGTWEEAEEYLETLRIKYGLEPGNYAPLDSLMTPEEMNTLINLTLHGSKFENT